MDMTVSVGTEIRLLALAGTHDDAGIGEAFQRAPDVPDAKAS